MTRRLWRGTRDTGTFWTSRVAFVTFSRLKPRYRFLSCLKGGCDIRWINSKAFSWVVFCILFKAFNKPSNSLLPMQQRFFFVDQFSHEFSPSNEPDKSIGKNRRHEVMFEYIYLFLVCALIRDGASIFAGKNAAKLNDANNKLIRCGRPGS